MPFVYVEGLGYSIDPRNLATLAHHIQATVVNIPELELKPEQVTVRFPSALATDPSVVSVRVEFLFDTASRTPPIRERFAEAIALAMDTFIKRHLPECRLLEVLLQPPYAPSNGFVQKQYKRSPE